MPLMTTLLKRRRLFCLVLMGACLLASVALLCGGWLFLRTRTDRVAHYPGAQQVSEHRLVDLYPRPHLRLDSSYRTPEDFPKVYNWYSKGFALGPERQAQSNCIHLYDTSSLVLLTRHVSVTLCDTPGNRLIFVQRSLIWSYRP